MWPVAATTESPWRLQAFRAAATWAVPKKLVLDRLDRSSADLRAIRARICAIGPATHAAIEALHLKVDQMGKEYVAEGLLETFGAQDLAGKHVLLQRAAVARDLVPVELTRRGALVDVVEAYRTVMPESALQQAREIFHARRRPDWIAFTNSSTVHNVAAAAGVDLLRDVRAAPIGPITTQAARDLGIEVTVEAGEYTIDGLVACVANL